MAVDSGVRAPSADEDFAEQAWASEASRGVAVEESRQAGRKTDAHSEGRPALHDAIGALRADHRYVEQRFEAFQAATDLRQQEELALELCQAIRLHLALDRTVFYPAFLRSTGDTYRHAAALAEHHAIGELVDEIEAVSATSEMFCAKVFILCELFRQHVREEERAKGIFCEITAANIDLQALGASMAVQRRHLIASVTAADSAA